MSSTIPFFGRKRVDTELHRLGEILVKCAKLELDPYLPVAVINRQSVNKLLIDISTTEILATTH